MVAKVTDYTWIQDNILEKFTAENLLWYKRNGTHSGHAVMRK